MNDLLQKTPVLQKSIQLERGKAAEYFVCANLLLQGRTAFPSDQGLPYDIIVDTGCQILKVQVKSTLKAKNRQSGQKTDAYYFNIKRAGRGSKRVYGKNEFDMYALVALDKGLVAYLPACDTPRQYIAIRDPELDYGLGGIASREFIDCSFDKALARLLEFKLLNAS